MKTEKYRFDHQTGSVYEYDAEAEAYVHCGKLNGRSEKEFLSDYEEQKHYNSDPAE